MLSLVAVSLVITSTLVALTLRFIGDTLLFSSPDEMSGRTSMALSTIAGPGGGGGMASLVCSTPKTPSSMKSNLISHCSSNSSLVRGDW